MSTLATNAITDASGGNTASINGYTPTMSNMAGRNLVINGAMQVAQRGTSASVSDNSNEGYSTLDRWYIQFNGSIGGSITYSQSSDAPSGFANSAKIQCASTHTPAAFGEYLSFRTTLEAQNLQQFGYGTSDAKEITLSWYMKVETYSGPISVGFQTIDGTSEYFVKSVTPTSSWTRYSITVPASTTATINNDNGAGLQVEFVLSGDTANTTFDRATDSTAWETTRYQYVSDVGNILSNTSNAIYITGVQLEAGSVATPFEHVDYGEMLRRCQRYYWKASVPAVYPSTLFRPDGIRLFLIPLKQTMRASPTATYTYSDDGTGVALNGASVITSPDFFRAVTFQITQSNADPRLTAFDVSAEL